MNVSGIKAGKAFILIEAVDRTGKVLTGIKNRLGKVGADITNMGRSMAIRAAAALTPVAMSAQTFANFDDVMLKVEARTTGTIEQMRALRDQAQSLGRTSAFSATQIGGLMNELAQKGFERTAVAEMTGPILDLARAAGEGQDLAMDALQSASLISGVMQAYGLGAEKAAELSDKFAVAAIESNFNLEELVTTMSYAAAASARFKVPLDNVLAMAAAMRDLNIDASIVGTAIRNIQTYAAKGKEQEEFNAKLFELTGNMIDFTDASKNLADPLEFLLAIAKVTKDLGTSQQAELYDMIFETRAGVPAAALGKAADKLGFFIDKLRTADGVSAKASRTMDRGLGGAFRFALRQIEAVGLAIGDSLAPSLITLRAVIAPTIDAFIGWVMANKSLVTSMVASIAAFGAAGLALLVLGQSLLLITPLLGALATLTAAAPWLLMAAGIFAGVHAIEEFHGGLDDTRARLGQLQATGLSIFTSMRESVLNLANSITEFLSPALTRIAEEIKAGDLPQAIKILEATFNLVFVKIQAGWSDVINSMLRDMQRLKMGSAASMADFMADAIEFVLKDNNLLTGQAGVIAAKYAQALRDTAAGIDAESGRLLAPRAHPEIEAAEKLLQGLLQPDLSRSIDEFNDLVKGGLGSPGAGVALKEAVDALIIKGGAGATGPGSAIKAAERGTVEGLRQFMENQANAIADPMDRTAEATAKTAEKVEDMDEKLEQILEMGGLGLV